MVAAPEVLRKINAIVQSELGYDTEVVSKYRALKEAALERPVGYTLTGKAGGFDKLSQAIADQQLSDSELGSISQLMAFDSIILNATRFAINAKKLQPLHEQMQSTLKDLRAEGYSDDDINAGLNDMVISLVHTMHPTVYHTPAAKTFEKELTQLLETPGNLQAPGMVKDAKMILTEKGEKAIRDLCSRKNGFFQNFKEGKVSITPQRPMTLAEETSMEDENWVEIRKCIDEVVEAWNKVAGPNLQISDERKEEIFQLRSWGKSADADGREKSTAEFLYRSIQRAVDRETNSYTGQRLDLRQNSEIHKNYISSLIQVKYRNSNTQRYGEDKSFVKFCEDFMKDRSQNYSDDTKDGKPTWYGEEDSIFQQLTSKDRAEFIAEILVRGDRLVPNRIEEDTLLTFAGQRPETPADLVIEREIQSDHQPKIHGALELRHEFLSRYKKYIEPRYNIDTISYQDMIKITIPYDPAQPKGVQVSLRGAYDAMLRLNGFFLDEEGERFTPIPGGNPNGSTFEFWKYVTPQQIQCINFLQGTKKWIDSSQVKILEKERNLLTDTSRRLTVLKDAIDKYGSKVSDRYQIANFEEPADFLTVMKLFEDAKLITIDRTNKEKPVVSNAQLDIMPLLETENDLKNSNKIFSDLLENEVVKSYWKERGKACIMLGFSDGAASAGNFASQWAIYNATRELTELFAKEGIKVEFLQGRGRGTDRGGTIDPSLQFDLLPPEATCFGRYDVTIQSDLPMDMATSPAYGKDYLGKILLGNLKSYVRGKETRERLSDPARVDARAEDGRESVITAIANKASAIYNQIVRRPDEKNIPKDEDALTFLNGMPDNPFRSSRATARGGAVLFKEFDKVRAIPKEYLANTADLPFHNVGLGTALSENSENIRMLKNHPFFRSILKTVDTGMMHFDPEIAERYGELTGAKGFVKNVTTDLEQLRTFAKTPSMENLMPAVHQSQRKIALNDPAPSSSGLDELSHALILSSVKAGKAAKPDIQQHDQKAWAKTLYNFIFTSAQEVGHRYLSRDVGPTFVVAA